MTPPNIMNTDAKHDNIQFQSMLKSVLADLNKNVAAESSSTAPHSAAMIN